MKRVKKFRVILRAEQKVSSERKESGFCSYRCFCESEKMMCEKIFSKRAAVLQFFFFLSLRQVSWPIITSPLFSELSFALKEKEFYSALRSLVLLKKLKLKKLKFL